MRSSLPPWPRLYIEADSSCMRRNHLSIRCGWLRTNSQDTISIISEPNTKPSAGDSTMKVMVLIRPDEISASVPSFATAAPTSPPIKACDDDDGMP